MMKPPSTPVRRPWLNYATLWRWHFYAALLCLPFICWLAITGSIYLFRPDIEAWLDRPYESLQLDGPRVAPSREANAAVAAMPGSLFSHYEPPATPTGAAQIVVARDGHLFRVYIHPYTLQAMKVIQDDHRLMDLVAHLHGQLLLGNGGSILVEVAASWAVVMILTGLYLWWPRNIKSLGGVLYPRLQQRGRLFWRDLHAVTALWVSVITLFLLLSGLPWSANWGNYLTWARNHWSATTGKPDWPIGGTELPLAIPKHNMPGMTADEMAAKPSFTTQTVIPQQPQNLQALDRLVVVVSRLNVPRPIWISPPAPGFHEWTISSHIQNRPLRVTYMVDPQTGSVTAINDFARQNIVDKVVNVVIATHEGQLFGRINQGILLLTAISLLLVSISAVIMWWRRRPEGILGAPPLTVRSGFSITLGIVIAALSLLLPLFAATLLLVWMIDRTVLPYLPATRHWLGLASRIKN